MRLHRLSTKNWVSLLFSLIVFAVPLAAQNGRYHVRFTVKEYACAAQNVTIAVQVRAADANSTFNMGDANYRFEYDPRVIKNPRIVSQENYSNIAPASDNNYNSHNLNGSSAGTSIGLVSLNTFYSGANNGAKRVDTTWSTISCIRFDVLSGQNCFALKWHDDQTFPISGMSEVIIVTPNPFQYDLAVVKAGGIFGNLQACFDDLCANRPPSVVGANLTIPEDSMVTRCFKINDPDTNDVHTASLCKAAANGVATVSVNNQTHEVCLVYRPNKDFNGLDSVCIEVCDGGAPAKCGQVRIPITVLGRPDTPSVIGLPITIAKDSSYTTCLPINDPDRPDRFTATLCGVKNGTATPSVNGRELCYTYKPNAGFIGKDTICFTICDSFGLCRQVLIPVTVLSCIETNAPRLNCPPSVEVTTLGAIVKNDLNFISSARLADNCNDVNVNFAKPAAQGDCTIPTVSQIAGDTTGSAFKIGTNALIFEAKTASGLSSRCTVNVVVTKQRLIDTQNDTIVACARTEITLNGRTAPNGSNYRWVAPDRTGSNGQSIKLSNLDNSHNGTYVYSSSAGTCQIKDSVLLQVIDKPLLTNDAFKVEKGNALTTVSVLTNDTLLRGAKMTVRNLTSATNGVFFFYPDGAVSYRPADDFVGRTQFAYEVCYDACPNACATATVTIDVFSNKREDIKPANIITPNGDGVNDALVIKGLDLSNNESQITIYNQWGNVVYTTKEYKNNWEGTFNDQALPDGTYYYVFKLKPDSEAIKDFVTIIR
jgi:gliding motility-associated-like protein